MKSNAQFLEDLSRSDASVAEFAALLRSNGVRTFLPPGLHYPAGQMASDGRRVIYSDKGDMTIQARVEHKVRSLNFTSRDDYPFKTVFIDEKYKIDNQKKDDALLAYVIQNKSGTRIAVIYGWTKRYWQVERVFDPKQQRHCENYAVPLAHVRFCDPSDFI